jgi:flavin reductase (DIM6/NTAB) family NADH-FMN oxidoreductase RutF
MFEELKRQQFRNYFQPSRILLGLIPAPTESGVNVITLCFSMYCSYKPPMMAVAIQKRSASYELIQNAEHFVLSVPGESLADASMFCGTTSMSKVDKVTHLGLPLLPSLSIDVPGISNAIANIEMERNALVKTGDHIVVIGRVLRFRVNTTLRELPLVSFGANEEGYRLLSRHGVHRIGTVLTAHAKN